MSLAHSEDHSNTFARSRAEPLSIKLAEAADEIAQARVTAALTPDLLKLVNEWGPLRLDEARKDAAHSAADEANSPDEEDLEDAWHEARDAAREVAGRVLQLQTKKRLHIHAMAQTYLIMMGKEITMAGDFSEEYRGLVQSMMRGLQPDPPRGSRPPVGTPGPALRSVDTAGCPAAALAQELEAIIELENAADAAETVASKAGNQAEAKRQTQIMLDCEAARWKIVADLATVQATSLTGAAAQIAAANHVADQVRGNSTQKDRDAFHDIFEALMKSACTFLSGQLTPNVWSYYVGGYHPASHETADAQGPVRVAA